MRIGIAYTLGRVCAVATRPVSLLIANNYLDSTAAQNLAVVFLASALGAVAVAIDPHRRLLQVRFENRGRSNGLTFYLYATSLALLLIAGSGVAAAIGAYFTGSALLSIAAIAYFVSERFGDEIQRLRIFEQRFQDWGHVAMWRTVVQIGTLGVLVASLGKSTPAWLLGTAVAASNAALFLPQLPRALFASLRRLQWPEARWLMRRAVQSVLIAWPIWVTAQLTSAFAYLDRMVALVLDKATLPLFMIVVMCFSIVQLSVDFFYLSRYRRDYVEQRATLRTAFGSPEFIWSFVAGLAAGAVVCVLALALAKDGEAFPLSYIIVIACMQTAVAISFIPREILYWSHHLQRIMSVELLFWGLFGAVVVAGWLLDLSRLQIFALVVATAAGRLAHYVFAAGTALPQRRPQ